MAEYAPTTDFHMRTAFVTAIPRPESGDVWDRWQATHDEAVRQEVRERISQDIELERGQNAYTASDWSAGHRTGMTRSAQIARGEAR
jgi:hypothetical protein